MSMKQSNVQQPTEYTDGRTKQSFKNETDINQIIEKHYRMGTISHLEQWGGQYGDLSNFDFQEAQNQMAKANSMFEALPSAVRNRFANSPEKFFEYVNDPDNADSLEEKIPELMRKGSRPLPTAAEVVDPKPTAGAPESAPNDG